MTDICALHHGDSTAECTCPADDHDGGQTIDVGPVTAEQLAVLDGVIALCHTEQAKAEANPTTDGLQYLMAVALSAMPTLLGGLEAVRARVTELEAERDQHTEAARQATNHAINSAATIATVRHALAGHPRCEEHPEGDVIKCGWKRAVASVQAAVDAVPAQQELITSETSDGYHTFAELYHYRMLYNAALFNEWAAQGLYDVHKSVRHSDGEVCFDGRWFVVYAQLPTGQISNHYEIGADSVNWYKFQVPIRDTGAEWDGHTPREAAERLATLLDSPVAQREPIGYLPLVVRDGGRLWLAATEPSSRGEAESRLMPWRGSDIDCRVVELHEPRLVTE